MKMSHAFDPVTLSAMAKAFEKACHSMHDWGYPQIIREVPGCVKTLWGQVIRAL